MSRSPSIQLRQYLPHDFEALYDIDQACYEPTIAYSRREMRNYLRFPGADCIVAQWEKKLVGFIITAHEETWAYVITIDVLEAYRRHGVGTLLLRSAEEKLRSAGVRVVGLETATDNASAIAFWQKHGYRKRVVRKNYYPGGRDAFSMTKLLE